MSNQDFERDSRHATQAGAEGMSRNTADKTQDMRDKAQQAFTKASDMARDAGEKAIRHASPPETWWVTQFSGGGPAGRARPGV